MHAVLIGHVADATAVAAVGAVAAVDAVAHVAAVGDADAAGAWRTLVIWLEVVRSAWGQGNGVAGKGTRNRGCGD